MSGEAMKEEVRDVASWRTKPSEYRPLYGVTDAPQPIDHAEIVRELALRIATLQSAGRRVLVSVNDSHLMLKTVVLVPAPPPPESPAPLEPQAKAPSPSSAKRRSKNLKRSRSRP